LELVVSTFDRSFSTSVSRPSQKELLRQLGTVFVSLATLILHMLNEGVPSSLIPKKPLLLIMCRKRLLNACTMRQWLGNGKELVRKLLPVLLSRLPTGKVEEFGIDIDNHLFSLLGLESRCGRYTAD
jgi:hypothetical protein